MAKAKSRPGVYLSDNNDIIGAILRSNFNGVVKALSDDPNCVNAIHNYSGMNAAMLSATGELPVYLEKILEFGHYLDFEHRDRLGCTLLQVALRTMDIPTIDVAQGGYERFAPHLVNNWPEPYP